MKTIGIRDLYDGSKKIRIYNPNSNLLDKQTRLERIFDGLQEIKNLGNVAVYYVHGNKYRLLFVKGL